MLIKLNWLIELTLTHQLTKTKHTLLKVTSTYTCSPTERWNILFNTDRMFVFEIKSWTIWIQLKWLCLYFSNYTLQPNPHR